MYSFKGWQNNKNHVFPSRLCISNEKTCYCYTFYNENHTTYLYITCNKILFVKKIIAYFRYSPTSPFFLLLSEMNTAIMQQLTRTARMLEAEWWQVCGETWVWGQRKLSQVLGAFGLLDFTMLRPFLAWCVFWNLQAIHFFTFPNFFQAAVNCG